jgi:Na+/melibiose symporter-like transporter
MNWATRKLQTLNIYPGVNADEPEPAMRNSLFLELESAANDLYSPDEAVPQSTQRRILFSCLFSLFVSQSLFLSVETILPLYVDKKFNEEKTQISPTLVSLIMISLEISSFIFSMIVPILSQRFGRKNVIVVGYLIVVLSTAALSFTYYIDDAQKYLMTAIGCRLIQGVGD